MSPPRRGGRVSEGIRVSWVLSCRLVSARWFHFQHRFTSASVRAFVFLAGSNIRDRHRAGTLSGCSFIVRSFPGVIAARQPPANGWQPFGLRLIISSYPLEGV